LKSKSMLLARVVFVASVVLTSSGLRADDDCHWWQFRNCEKQNQIEGLPSDAPHSGTLITVDIAKNELYLFEDGRLIDKATVATGSEKILKRGRRIWLFHTPRGLLRVLRKIEDPVWTKPDWAYIEDGHAVPPPDSPKRQIKGHLGKYALDLGDGVLIHGTDDPDSLGKRVSHGCIRVPDDALETVWNATRVGTPVYIFESEPVKTASSGRHSDLD
jgi:lipoprotein-anchoring transpeptidase ErfK/SrfK